MPDGLPGEALGHAGVITETTARQLDEQAVARGFLVTTSPRVDQNAVVAHYEALLADEEYDVGRPVEPAQVVEYRRIRNTPLVLAASVTAIGIGMLVVGVLSAVHHRRREYALLQGLGATRRQIVSMVHTEVLLSYFIVVGVGLIVGTIAGANVWNAFERPLGTNAGVQTQLATLVSAALIASLVIVIVVQAISRRRDITAPAHLLRTE